MNFEDVYYTYINQIFGDESVREIYMEVHPDPDLVLQTEEDAVHGHHHFVYNLKMNQKICSKTTTPIIQDPAHKNDTLCQSYSLAYYIGIRSPTHDVLVDMYRNILRDTKFMKKVDYELLKNPANKNHWKIYKNGIETGKNVSMNKKNIIKNISKVLDIWDSSYFLK